MRVHYTAAFLAIGIALPTPTSAQTWESMGATSTADVDLEALKAQIRDELKEELKAEIKAELAEEGAATGGVQQDAFAEDEWKWEEPVKPELNFLEFDGYFRLRYDLFKDLDLETFYITAA